jgi:GxxExxY protein
MDADEREFLVTRVVGALFEVSNTLGAGFLEKVYERALVIELNERGMRAVAQPVLAIHYKGVSVGNYSPDILVEDEILIELKCADALVKEHVAQCINYLRATDRKIALLVNFQRPRLEWKRVVLNLSG